MRAAVEIAGRLRTGLPILFRGVILLLGIGDLDSRVADALRARLWSLTSPRGARPKDAAARRALAPRTNRLFRRLLYTVPIGAAVGVGIGALVGEPGAAVGLGFLSAYLTGIGTAVTGFLGAVRGRDRQISAQELRALATGLELGKAETLYLDTVCALLEAGDSVDQETGRGILEAQNDLVNNARHVDERLDRLQKAASTESLTDLRAERTRLAMRLEAANDAQAREDLGHGLAMCDDRLRNAEALQPLIERMDAQREVVYQTLLSVQSSVSRLQVAPSAAFAPDVVEVRRVVGEVAAQTQAVEDAVREVLSLSGTI